MSTVALIVAAGRGIRAGSEVPKQYLQLAGKSVLAQSPVVRGINGSWEAYPLRGEGFGSGVQPKTPVKAPAPVPEPPLKQPYLDEWRALQARRSCW